MHLPSVAIIFLAISALFLALAARDYLRVQGSNKVARKTWLCIAMIFGVIGGWLYFFGSHAVGSSSLPWALLSRCFEQPLQMHARWNRLQ
jgi:hypothetical protein